MLKNPFLAIPQVESASSRSWSAGFLHGFQEGRESKLAQEAVETEDAEAFNRGVIDGQNAAIGGLEVSSACVDLNVEPPSLFHFATDAAAEAAFTAFGLTVKGISHIAGGLAEGIVAVVNLSIALETFSDDPDTAIAESAQRLRSALGDLGITSSMELFLGGGVDLSVAGCELKLTPIFRNLADATAATTAIGRSKWLIVSWRTDQSGGMRVVESSLP
jgi:hypothetical protein